MLPLTRPVADAHDDELKIGLVLPEQGGSASIRLFRQRTGRGQPCFIYLHGGYFNSGSIDEAADFARAVSSCADVIAVEYPLSPAVFPTALETCFLALDWVARNARRLKVDPLRIHVGGTEAGGNLAAALAMLGRDRLFDRHGQRQIVGQVLITPLLDPFQATPSLRAVASHPARLAWSEYLSKPNDAHHPYASPLRSRRLNGLPPALLVTAVDDPLRDEARLYASNLRNAGVDTIVHTNRKNSHTPTRPGDPGFASTVAAVVSFLEASAFAICPPRRHGAAPGERHGRERRAHEREL